jgi:putative flavoprotein involved in K+ transport
MSTGNGIDCVVVGAGPAGLAASAALTAHQVEHVVLERGRVGETWRTQRWDSFRLNTPGWMNQLLGEQPRDAFATGAEVVQRLEKVAADAPVRGGVAVERLRQRGDGFALETGGGGDLHARAVVVATGDQNVPRVPALARVLPDRVAQCHTADYRGPGALPDGAVLVVGSAQSGCQIAEDLLAGGRRVVLSTSPAGRFVEAGFFDQRPRDLPDPSVMRAAQPIVASGGRSLSLQALARAGATLVGRPVAVAGERVTFDDSVVANVAAGDAFAARARGMIDDLIARRGLEAPPYRPDDTERPVDLDPPRELDLRDQDIASVVWCTGFTGDFSFMDQDLVGADGQPRRQDAAAVAPGLWYVGLKWLVRRSSGILHGFPGDAAEVAAAVRAHLGN